MKLSVIILNYNVRYFLELCLLSVKRAIEKIDAEIIVIDNNSPDDSCAMVKDRFPTVRLIENKENIGFAKANNQAVKESKGQYLCILNPDTVLGENTFILFLKVIKSLSNPGILGPKLLDGTGSFLPESKRNIPSPKTSFQRLFGFKIGKTLPYYAENIGKDEVGEVPVLVGACMFCTKETYLSVEGFDEDYFMYGEDIDISYTLRQRGFYNYYIGTLSIIHYKGESTIRNNEYTQRFYGAMRLFYKKHFNTTVFFDSFVSFGIWMLSLKPSSRNRKEHKKEIKSYYLFSENELLKERLSLVLESSVRMISIAPLGSSGDEVIQVIFDREYISYKQIIEIMMQWRSPDITFRIKPEQCNYIIGSDLSDGKGAIIHL